MLRCGRITFQIIKAEKTIIARLSAWNRNWRLFAQSFLSSATCLSTTSLIMIDERVQVESRPDGGGHGVIDAQSRRRALCCDRPGTAPALEKAICDKLLPSTCCDDH